MGIFKQLSPNIKNLKGNIPCIVLCLNLKFNKSEGDKDWIKFLGGEKGDFVLISNSEKVLCKPFLPDVKTTKT